MSLLFRASRSGRQIVAASRYTSRNALRALSSSQTATTEARFASANIREQYAVQVTSAKLELPGRSMGVEVGRIAQLADSAVMAVDGETSILTTVVSTRDSGKNGSGMLPVTVDYKEKAFAGGRIPGNSQRREAAPREREVLCGRAIDRAIRPLFPAGFTNETQIVSTLLSLDNVGDYEVLALNSASLALTLAPQVPWDGPFGAVRVIQVDGKFIVNPTSSESKYGSLTKGGSCPTLDLLYVGTAGRTLMIEASGKEIPKDEFSHALELAHAAVQQVIEFQLEFAGKLSTREIRFDSSYLNRAIEENYSRFGEQARKLYEYNAKMGPPPSKEKLLHGEKRLMQQIFTSMKSSRPGQHALAGKVPDEVLSMAFRNRMLESKDIESVRPDGRSPLDLRQIDIETDVLPIVHGSALFKRGSTQCLNTVTLGTTDDVEKNHPYAGDVQRKNFMLHYNFPPFSVNEVGRTGSVNRRMIGHGALAEKAIAPVMPSREEFPYTVRVTSETMSSDGSSSMATVCGTSLALADAGVPIKKQVAGISVGIVLANTSSPRYESDLDDVNVKPEYMLLTDITGQEDHRGHMDFKLAGTRDGITAVQLDIKCNGIPVSIMQEAVDQAWEAKEIILSKMEKSQPRVRTELKKGVRKAKLVIVPRHKVKHLVGPRGTHLERILELTGAEVTVDKDILLSSDELKIVELNATSLPLDLETKKKNVGAVIYHTDDAKIAEAEKLVHEYVAELQPGETYNAVVKDVREFGAFVTLDGEHDAYLHIAEISESKFENISDEIQIGDSFKVLCLSSDDRGIRVSRKAAMRHSSKSLDKQAIPLDRKSQGDFKESETQKKNNVSKQQSTQSANEKEYVYRKPSTRNKTPSREARAQQGKNKKHVKYERRSPRTSDNTEKLVSKPNDRKIGLLDSVLGFFGSSKKDSK